MRQLRSAIVMSLCLVPAIALAQPSGSEFQANTYTTNDQRRPSVAMDASGDFVVVWQSNSLPAPASPATGQDGDGVGVFGRRFMSDGTPIAGEFAVNSYTTGPQYIPHVAANPAGGFVVVWNGSGAGDPYYGIFAQRYDADGDADGGEFLVNSYTSGAQYYPQAAFDADGKFVVVWVSPNDGGGYGISGQRFDSAGADGGEFQVNTYTTGHQTLPGVAKLPAGGFVVVWTSYGDQDGPYGYSAVMGRLFDSTGTPTTSEFVVNTTTLYYQYSPAVASDSAGKFVVVWNGYGYADADSYGVFGRRFMMDGTAIDTSEFPVNTYTTGAQAQPQVATDGTDFIVAWQGPGDDSGSAVFAQRFDFSSGAMVGSETQVNAYVNGNQRFPAVAMNGAGDVALAWTSGPLAQPFQPDLPPGQDGDRDGIFGQVCLATPDTSPPSVRVANPTASVKLYQSYDYAIRWEAADNCGLESFDVFYSLDGFVTPVSICTGLDGTQRSCLWSSPLPLTSTGRVKVVAVDASNNSAFDISDANFRVVGGTPSVTVTEPNLSGITWTAGTTRKIKWTHNFGSGEPVTIEVSRNNGANWELIEIVPTSGATNGLYNWFVTGRGTTTSGAPAALALIRVSWTANTDIQDRSNAAFTILPRNRVIQPNEAVTWVIGSVQKIKWKHNYGANQIFRIEVNRDFATTPGGPWELIASNVVGTATSGTFDWTVTGPATASARIRVFKQGDRRNSIDTSDVDFTIVP